MYLGISGVLHPSESLYILVNGRSPWDAGHRAYEGTEVLQQALAAWPGARIVLTSTQPWSKGLGSVLGHLRPSLASRVVGFTFEDLTTHLRRGRFNARFSDDDYWRCNKSDIVRLHTGLTQPRAWVAIDDDDILWTDRERAEHLVAVDGCLGLAHDAAAQERLLTVLTSAFGDPPQRSPDDAANP